MEALEFINIIEPEHDRTSCSDDNIDNGFYSRGESWHGKIETQEYWSNRHKLYQGGFIVLFLLQLASIIWFVADRVNEWKKHYESAKDA